VCGLAAHLNFEMLAEYSDTAWVCLKSTGRIEKDWLEPRLISLLISLNKEEPTKMG
jgi:hypothetical protein